MAYHPTSLPFTDLTLPIAAGVLSRLAFIFLENRIEKDGRM
jgi:hypothetical protein